MLSVPPLAFVAPAAGNAAATVSVASNAHMRFVI
jgi:hypothetical protein